MFGTLCYEHFILISFQDLTELLLLQRQMYTEMKSLHTQVSRLNENFVTLKGEIFKKKSLARKVALMKLLIHTYMCTFTFKLYDLILRG